MNLLVVPKPLFTDDMSVKGYFLAYQYGNAILESVKSNPLDRAMNSPFIDKGYIFKKSQFSDKIYFYQ